MWFGVTTLLLTVAACAVLRQITWYLAAWQFGYLTFGRDLAHGAVFHRSAVLEALRERLPSRTDALVQSYVWDDGKLYCRFAPGFPLLLAVFIRLFGDGGVHDLNPVLFMLLLALLIVVGRRLFGSPWLATAIPALLLVFPTNVRLWALTPMPDLAAHLAGLTAVYVALGGRQGLSPRRAALMGLALGCAVSVRPDALLYVLPVALVAGFRRPRDVDRGPRPVVLAWATLAGLIVGLTPFLVYNWAATGNPLRPTQWMEVEAFFSPVPPVSVHSSHHFPEYWHGGSETQVQGGGLRLWNLPRTVPGNVALLRHAYGDLPLAAAVWGAIVALLTRRTLFLTTVPYTIVALLFFSCWGSPNPRLLVGVECLVPFLVLQGTLGNLDVVFHFAERGRTVFARVLAAAVATGLLVGAVLAPMPTGWGVPSILVWVIVGTSGAGLLLAAAAPRARLTDVAAPLLVVGVAVLFVAQTIPALESRARFQAPELTRARASFAAAVESGSVVITTEDVGRPAENIEYYAGVPALYLTDLKRWRLSLDDAIGLLIERGIQPYLFVPQREPGLDAMVTALSTRFTVEKAASVPASQAIDYFVASALHRGVAMELYRFGARQ